MQTIEELNNSLLKLYEDLQEDKVSIRKAMALSNVANTLLRGIVIQTQMCLPEQSVSKTQEIVLKNNTIKGSSKPYTTKD